MFVDSSAIVSILNDEPEASYFLNMLEERGPFITSPLAVLESVIRMAALFGQGVDKAQALVEEFLIEAAITIAPVDANVGRLAIAAFDRYGKGRHPAKLNFGDCFSYAMARHHEIGLLYKGDDFAQTDLAALP